MSRRGWLLFLAMGVIWGVPYLFIKVAVEHLTPASLVFLRTTVAAVLLTPIAAVRGELRPLLNLWKPLVAYTAAELAIPWLFLANAERRLSSSLAGLLLAAVPLVGAVLGWVTKSDRLDWRRAFGLLIGLTGVAALVGLDLGAGDITALLQMGVVAVGYAVGPFILARYLSDAPELGVVAASLVLTGVVYAPVAVVQLPRTWPPTEAIVSVLVLAVLCTAIAFLLFFALVNEVGPTRSTVITYINPAVAVALGAIFLDEPITKGILVGFVLVLLGSAIATRRSRARTVALTEP
jgi:drug/metabolite transporter (DMT)-like permease